MDEQQRRAAEMCEEIAGLARRHLEAPDGVGIEDIDAHIMAATQEGRWDDVSKWHRVRLRYIRFQQERELGGLRS
ncbi:hypothetical protein OF829_07560 [Sphingomonas sp. LB-2]|uniref:hypothetical protein n=1 Tax=Sphingomonas caeni TaxID=2984949 RepID=UPI00222F3851|nr:hypothetical protein [Sphingomonas caeni]MCW3847092.1 hypothetical protein [Sphingomonas caeni]